MATPLTEAEEEELDELFDALHRVQELAEDLAITIDIEQPLSEIAAEIERRARKQIL